MSPSRVKDPSFALFAHPCPRLALIPLAPLSEHEPVGIVFRMNVGFIPAFDWRDPLHNRMIGPDDAFAKNPGAVALELRADQFDIFGRVEKTVGSAMERRQTATGL